MLYQAIKALHLTAVMLWMSGMLLSPLLLVALGRTDNATSRKAGIALRKALTLSMSIGILSTWVLGVWLLVEGDWFPSGWMSVKLALVVALSALHGAMSAQLVALATRDDYQVPRWIRYILQGELLMVAVIVFLVVAKPF